MFLKHVYIAILLGLTITPASAQSNSLTMTTFYPSPNGNYDKILANNIGIGTGNPAASLDVKGNVIIKGSIIASEFKTSDKSSMMTVILYDQTGVRRSCPAGTALIGQWVTSNGAGEFKTIDSLGNQIPEGASGVIGLCSAI